MPKLKIIRSELVQLAASGSPIVAVIAGGTTGIGSYIAIALAETYRDAGHKLRVYIVGRNVSRGEGVIARAREICQGSEWIFVHARDLASLADVDRACGEIARLEGEKSSAKPDQQARLDLLYMTFSVPILAERYTTPDGLDALISTLYYSRIRFILRLLPLLKASPLQGHAISVYAGSMAAGTVSKSDELPIGCPASEQYGVASLRKHVCFMKTFLFEELARQHAGSLRLTHIYPGLVDGPGFLSPELPRWFRVTWRVMKPVSSLYMTSSRDCGAVMLYLATAHFPADGKTQASVSPSRSTTGELGGGSYALGQRADAGHEGQVYAAARDVNASELVWQHTMAHCALEVPAK